MADQRRRDVEWNVCRVGEDPTYDGAKLAVLMDIRDQLRRLNSVLHCRNFLAIPSVLKTVRANTTAIKRLLDEKRKTRSTKA